MRKFELPFQVPMVTNYPLFTAVLGILTANRMEQEWLYNNYIQLWGFHEFKRYPYWTDFKFGNDDTFSDICKSIDRTELSRVDVGEEVICVLRQKLQEENYVFLSLDMFYIDEWWASLEEKKPTKHQVLIYGYTEKGFLMADFFCEKYQTKEVDYDSFVMAYHNFEAVNDVDSDYCVNIELLKLNDIKEELDFARMKKFLEDFINSTDTALPNYLHDTHAGEIDFGFSFYDNMLKYLIHCVGSCERVDVKPFYLMKAQAEIMEKRLSAIWPDSDLSTDMRKWKGKTKKIILFILVFNRNSNPDVLRRAISLMKDLIAGETETFAEIYKLFEK